MRVCDCCGRALLSGSHPVSIHADAQAVWRLALCVRCRDVIVPALVDTAQSAALALEGTAGVSLVNHHQ